MVIHVANDRNWIHAVVHITESKELKRILNLK